MKIFLHFFMSLVLALNISSANADSHKNKSGNKPSTSMQNPTDEKRSHDGDDRQQKGGHNNGSNGDLHGQPRRGNERSREMLEQRDERKEAKSEYRSDRVPGQEGNHKGNGDEKEKQDDKHADKPWYDIL